MILPFLLLDSAMGQDLVVWIDSLISRYWQIGNIWCIQSLDFQNEASSFFVVTSLLSVSFISSENCCCVPKSCLTFLQSHGLSMGFFPGKNTGVGCHFLLHKIFPTQRLNLGLPCCRQTLYCLSHQENRKAVAILLRNQTGFESDFTTEIISLRLIFALET